MCAAFRAFGGIQPDERIAAFQADTLPQTSGIPRPDDTIAEPDQRSEKCTCDDEHESVKEHTLPDDALGLDGPDEWVLLGRDDAAIDHELLKALSDLK